MDERPEGAGARWPFIILGAAVGACLTAIVAGIIVWSPWSGGDDSPAEAVQAPATSTPLPGEAEAFDLLAVAPPQYQGMTKAQEEQYREFASEVRRVDEAMAADDIYVSARNVATVLSADYGGTDTLKAWTQLQTDNGWKQLQSPAYWEYIGTHLEDLRLFAPWRMDARREKEMLGIEVTSFEEPTRPKRQEREKRDTRLTRQDVQEQAAIRNWLEGNLQPEP